MTRAIIPCTVTIPKGKEKHNRSGAPSKDYREVAGDDGEINEREVDVHQN